MDQEVAPLLSSQPSTATPVQDRRKPNAMLDIWLGFSPYFKYCIGLELLCELAMMIITVPMVSSLEHSLCMRHYHGEIPDADACKIPPIQQSLAEVRGWTASFETIAGMAHWNVLQADANASQLFLLHCPWVGLRIIEASAGYS
jgi:hypothetical protein